MSGADRATLSVACAAAGLDILAGGFPLWLRIVGCVCWFVTMCRVAFTDMRD